MLKTALLVGAAIGLTGCALFQSDVASALSRDRTASAPQDYSGAVTPVSLRAEQTVGTSGPIGLVPCARGQFPARNCWRRGDQHVLFPDAMPDGVSASAVSGTIANSADDQ